MALELLAPGRSLSFVPALCARSHRSPPLIFVQGMGRAKFNMALAASPRQVGSSVRQSSTLRFSRVRQALAVWNLSDIVLDAGMARARDRLGASGETSWTSEILGGTSCSYGIRSSFGRVQAGVKAFCQAAARMQGADIYLSLQGGHGYSRFPALLSLADLLRNNVFLQQGEMADFRHLRGQAKPFCSGCRI